MSPRWYDKRTGDNLAMDTGGGALARLWATALANKVHTPFVNATGSA
jgi:hydrogenase large subunit